MLRNTTIFAFIIIILLVSGIPIYWTFVTSISLDRDLADTSKVWYPPNPTFENYKEILGASKMEYSVAYEFKVTLINSALVSLSVTAVALFLASLSAYSIERLKVPLRNTISFLVVLTQMLPPVILVIPIYLIFGRMGLLNRKLSLVVIYTAMNLPFAIWILSSYFRKLPVSVEEAAIIDGCGYIETLWRIVIPLSKPALFTAGIFVFLASWNEFLIALVLTTDLKAKTLPIAISEFMGRYYTDYPLMCTAGIISMVPPIVFASIFQRYLVEGLAKGAVKE
ncbi:MAG TPA: carbohydrate ABC transporter permease [Thermotogae bacterium]|nr:multiple sugar transport system permease protein [Thermotogota bacterium]HCZ06057.1 carbohydrate ABC transporter permease [Thermotogota bacterium]